MTPPAILPHRAHLTGAQVQQDPSWSATCRPEIGICDFHEERMAPWCGQAVQHQPKDTLIEYYFIKAQRDCWTQVSDVKRKENILTRIYEPKASELSCLWEKNRLATSGQG